MNKFFAILGVAALLVTGCTNKDQLKKVLEENPEIVINSIEKNPLKYMEALGKAQQDARKEMFEKEEQKAKQAMDDEFKNPKVPVIEEGRAVMGPKDAPITIVEYSDFQCPMCGQGYSNLKEVKEKYGDKVRFVYKHFPIGKFEHSETASRYFEAIAMQDPVKAYKFHDQVFGSQRRLGMEGVKFLDESVKKAGADLAKVKKDMNAESITARIEADKAEAAKFEFTGTPGFLVNGVSLRGAYPPPAFIEIIERQLGAAK